MVGFDRFAVTIRTNFLTDALQKERAAGVAIINYTGLIYALSVGWIVFGEAQSLFSLAGMLLVVVSVIASVLSTRRQNLAAATEISIG